MTYNKQCGHGLPQNIHRIHPCCSNQSSAIVYIVTTVRTRSHTMYKYATTTDALDLNNYFQCITCPVMTTNGLSKKQNSDSQHIWTLRYIFASSKKYIKYVKGVTWLVSTAYLVSRGNNWCVDWKSGHLAAYQLRSPAKVCTDGTGPTQKYRQLHLLHTGTLHSGVIYIVVWKLHHNWYDQGKIRVASWKLFASEHVRLLPGLLWIWTAKVCTDINVGFLLYAVMQVDVLWRHLGVLLISMVSVMCCW